MTDAGNRRSGRRDQRVQGPSVGEHGGAAKKRSSSAQVRSAAGKKAVQTRARRATVLKTLKTGEESFSHEE